MNKLKVGVVGLGYWGPNYIRNFIKHEATEIIWGCDNSISALKKIGNLYPQIRYTTNFEDLINDPTLNMIAIATPPHAHYQLAVSALNANKHVFVAKPLTTKVSDAKKLVEIAKRKKLILHCDLTFLYTGAVQKIKDLVKNNTLGTPLYYDSIRTNLGLIQNDVNVIWDLAPHDLSIIDYCFGFKPKQVYAVGSKLHTNSTKEEIANLTVKYTNNFIAQIHISWISPVKIRTILIGGKKKMVLYDDIQPDEKIKLYDKGINFNPKSITPYKPVYRSGNITIPKIKGEEALYTEIDYILSNIKQGGSNYSNTDLSINLLKILEASDQSLKEDKAINIDED